MAIVQANTELLTSKLLQAADELKALIFVSAAAILSRAQEDIAANAQLVTDRLENVGALVDEVRNTLANRTGAGFAAKLKGKLQEIDEESFIETLNGLDFRLERFEATFWDVVGSSTRDGYDLFADNLGLLGTTLQVAIGQASGGKVPFVAHYFDSVLSEAVKTLSKDE